MHRGAWWATVHGVGQLDMTEQLTHTREGRMALLRQKKKKKSCVSTHCHGTHWSLGTLAFTPKETVLLLFSRPVLSNSLRPHELQHAKPPCPSPSPGVCASSCSLHRWCSPAIAASGTLPKMPHPMMLTQLWAMPCRAAQGGRVTAESSDKMRSAGGGNSKPPQYTCPENLRTV